jgi:hypothetical protein
MASLTLIPVIALRYGAPHWIRTTPPSDDRRMNHSPVENR